MGESLPPVTASRESPSDGVQTVDELYRQVRRYRTVAELSRSFSQVAPDLPSVLEMVARRLADEFGDACIIRLLSADGRWLEPVALAHRDPQRQDLLRDVVADIRLPADSDMTRPLIVPRLGEDLTRHLAAIGYSPWLERVGIEGMLAYPLHARSGIIGMLSMVRDRGSPRYSPDEQEMLGDLADRAALAIENARLVKQARDAEAQMRALFEGAADAILISDPDGVYLDVNSAACEMLGCRREDIIGRHVWDFSPDPARSRRVVQEAMQRIDAEGSWRSVSERVRADGAVIRTEAHVVSVPLADERQVYVAIMRDISERERLVTQIETERARLEAVLQQMPSGVIIAEAPSGRLLLANAQVERIWGYPFLAAASIDDYSRYHGFHADGRPYQPEEWPLARSILTGETVEREEIRFQRGDGSFGTMEVSSAPIRDANDQIVAGVAVFSDTTERTRARERLEALYAVTAALSSAVTPADIVDVIVQKGLSVIGARQGAVLLVNEAGDALEVAGAIGYPADMIEQWQRTPLEVPIPLTDAVRRREPIWADTRAEMLERYPVLRDAARPGTTAFSAIPLLAGHRPIGVLGVSFTSGRAPENEDRAFILALAAQCAQALERGRLFAAERQARQEAERAARQREEFLSIAAHELKTPLTTIKGSTQLLARRSSEPTARQARQLAQLQGQVDRLEALVGDLLDVSRIEQGRLALRCERLDLRDVVASVLAAFPNAAGHRFVVDAPEPVIGVWDRTRMEQVITNLVSNAVKYSPPGTEVHLVVHERDGAAVLSVRDQGFGITDEEMPRLFQPFSRSDRSRAVVDGTGLGLYITRRIVEQHGGTISVDSRVGQGSTFTVTLPVNPPPA